jgi:hypothetical protein
VRTIPILRKLFNKAKKYNIVTGIIIFDIIAVILLFIFPYFIILYYGEFGVIFGALIGMIFTYRNRTPNQEILKISLYFIVIGAILTAFTLTTIEWVITIPTYGVNSTVFLSLFVSNLIMIFIFTIIVGVFMGYYYSKKSKSVKDKGSFDDLFASLKEK